MLDYVNYGDTLEIMHKSRIFNPKTLYILGLILQDVNLNSLKT